MIIILNGTSAEIPDGTSLQGLLASGGHDSGRGVAIAMNGEVVPRGRWTSQLVAEGDLVEVLTASQGG